MKCGDFQVFAMFYRIYSTTFSVSFKKLWFGAIFTEASSWYSDRVRYNIAPKMALFLMKFFRNCLPNQILVDQKNFYTKL